MQKVRRHTFPLLDIVLRPLVSVWFQVLLTRLIAVLFTVQSPYLFTIGHRGIFSLGQWSAQLRTEFHELRATLVRLSTPIYLFAYGAITRYGPPFQGSSAKTFSAQGARNPGTNPGLGCSDFARRYLRNRCLFIFLRVLRCFSSPRSLLAVMNWLQGYWVSPFRNLSDHSLVADSPRLIAGSHVFLRFSMPRHPPYTLSNLTTFIDHRQEGDTSLDLRALLLADLETRLFAIQSPGGCKRALTGPFDHAS